MDTKDLPRLYARLEGPFSVCCPNCGHISKAGGRHGKWDRRSSQFTCPECGRVWIVGLALWALGMGGAKRPALPLDQVPNRSEVAQLRHQQQTAQGGAVSAGRIAWRNGKAIRTNLLLAVCCCTRAAAPLGHLRVISAECPIHGEQLEEG